MRRVNKKYERVPKNDCRDLPFQPLDKQACQYTPTNNSQKEHFNVNGALVLAKS